MKLTGCFLAAKIAFVVVFKFSTKIFTVKSLARIRPHSVDTNTPTKT